MTALTRNFAVVCMSLAALAIAIPTSASDLWTAAAEGDTKQIRQLLKDGQDVNATDPNIGFTPLTHAVLRNQPKAVRLLVRNGADVDGGQLEGNTPLHAAVFLGHDKVVKELLRAGADPIKANNEGQIPSVVAATDWATTQGLASMLQLEVTEEAVMAGREKATALLDKQIDKLAKSDIRLAVFTGNERHVKRLARKVGDLNAVDDETQTTLIGTAAALGYPNVVQILAEAGADVNQRSQDGATPLLVAAFFGRIDTVKILLDHGADRTIANNEGMTPLAAANADMAIVDFIANLLNIELNYSEVIEGKKAAATLLAAN